MSNIPLSERLLANVGKVIVPEDHLLKSLFPIVEDDLGSVGLNLRVSSDLDTFEEVCKSTGKFLPNAFQRSMAPLPDGDAIWFRVETFNGDLVATIAHRVYRLPHHTLGDWLTTGSLFYQSPITQMAEGERFYLGPEADTYASSIRGTFIMAGGLWVSDAYKGRTNLARFLTQIGASFAYARWNAAPIISIVEDEVMQKMSAKYRFTNNVDGVYWYRPHKPHRTKMWLLGKTRETIIADTRAYLDDAPYDRLWIGQPVVEVERTAVTAGIR